MNLHNTEIDPQTQKTNLWLPKGKGGGINQEFGVKIYTVLYIKQITNKDLLQSTGNYTYNGREYKNIYIFYRYV